ncbi:hypothetical protein [Herbaspirillum sp. NPDC087042]|uniref:hypothetical protein n=1 Tax=Herbaspirillum sp. NPDC087042 TaxID=3364004 RepID=UPI0037F1F651
MACGLKKLAKNGKIRKNREKAENALKIRALLYNVCRRAPSFAAFRHTARLQALPRPLQCKTARDGPFSQLLAHQRADYFF